MIPNLQWRSPERRPTGLASMFIMLFVLATTVGPAWSDFQPSPIRQYTFGRVRQCLLSADGSKVVTTSEDAITRIWDAGTGQLLWSVDNSYSVQPALTPDGLKVIVPDRGSTINAYDLATGQLVQSYSAASTRFVGFCISPDGQRICASGYSSNAIHVWNLATGALLFNLSTNDSRNMYRLTSSPDGSIIIASGITKYIFNTATPASSRTFWSNGPIYDMVTTPGGKVLIASDKKVEIRDVSMEQTLATLPHPYNVNDVGISQDGMTAITGSMDRVVRLWDLNTSQTTLQPFATLSGHGDGPVVSACLSADGTRCATGSYDLTVRIWDVATQQTLRTLTGFSIPNYSIDYASDGGKFLTTHGDSTCLLWDSASGTVLHTIRHPDTIQEAIFSDDGSKVLTRSVDATARMWSTETGQWLKTFGGHVGVVDAADISADGRRVLTGCSMERKLRLWDADTGQVLRTYSLNMGGGTIAQFSPDGARFLGSSESAVIGIWETNSDATTPPVSLNNKELSSTFSAATFSPDSARILTLRGLRTIVMWDAATGQEIWSLTDSTQSRFYSAVFAPDGNTILIGGMNVMQLRDAHTGQLLQNFTNQWGTIRAVFSSDGNKMLSASDRGSIWLWGKLSGTHGWRGYE